MRHKCSAFLERNTEVPEVKSALHSIKILTESKIFFLKRLSFETELFQNDKGIIIKIDRSKDSKLTDFGKATLKDRYLGPNESYQDLFA